MPPVFSGAKHAASRDELSLKAQNAHHGRRLTVPWKRDEGRSLVTLRACPAPPCRTTPPLIPGAGAHARHHTPLLPVSAVRRLGELGDAAVGVIAPLGGGLLTYRRATAPGLRFVR